MKKWDRLAALVLFLIGSAAAWEAIKIGCGSFRMPGPGFYPFWLAVILGVVALIYFLNNLGKDPQVVALWEKGIWIRPLMAIIVMLGYGLLLDKLGFILDTFLLFLIWLLVIEREKLLTVALVSIIGTTAVYLLFTVLLQVQLPKGILF
ncbi:MAG TPA: hypothetical protein DD789_12565 [Firmicutes bacterium]|jgi:hypothetical protein|nr:hypothetical protein [Bacillota bacterium]